MFVLFYVGLHIHYSIALYLQRNIILHAYTETILQVDPNTYSGKFFLVTCRPRDTY